MELLYLWIEDYKNIKQQNFNFSPKYHFTYNIESAELLFKRKENVLLDNAFFEVKGEDGEIIGENITNVTAIVGENGVGKTSISSFIHQLPLADDYKKGFIVAYSSNIKGVNNTVDVHIYIDYYKHNIKSIRDEESEAQITKGGRLKDYDYRDGAINTYFNIPHEVYKGQSKLPNNSSTILYSTNIKYNYDNYLKVNKHHGYIDISTSYFLYKPFIQRYTIDKIKNYTIEEQLKQVKFYLNFQKKYKINIPISLPNMLAIRLKPTYGDSSYEKLVRRYDYKGIFNYNNSYVTNTFDMVENIYKAIWANIISYLYYTDKQKIIKPLSINVDVFHKIIASIMTEAENIKSALQALFSHKKLVDEKFFFKDKKVKFEKFSVFIEKKFSVKNIKLIGSQHFYISLKDANQLLKYSRYFDAFEFHWAKNNELLNLSNGEVQLLTFFSRIYDVREKIKEHSILIIDEGDLGLHPQWQKQYLRILLDILPKIFTDKKMQLILTSHSPFITSDLPKENVIFLRRGKAGEKLENNEDVEGKCIVADSFKQQTFGQNIHVLLSDSFFIEGGLIGDFVKEKINEIVRELSAVINDSNKLISKKRVKEINDFINMIGEKLIRVQLNLMLEEAAKNSNEDVQREYYRQKLEELNRKGGASND